MRETRHRDASPPSSRVCSCVCCTRPLPLAKPRRMRHGSLKTRRRRPHDCGKAQPEECESCVSHRSGTAIQRENVSENKGRCFSPLQSIALAPWINRIFPTPDTVFRALCWLAYIPWHVIVQLFRPKVFRPGPELVGFTQCSQAPHPSQEVRYCKFKVEDGKGEVLLHAVVLLLQGPSLQRRALLIEHDRRSRNKVPYPQSSTLQC
jgi:hypothetical protein